MIKLIFINSGNDNEEAGNANISSFPPLGIISMATMATEHFRDLCEVILIDGQISSLEETCRTIENEEPDAVLISMYCTGIHYSIECAKKSHDVGAIAILGNDHAKAHYEALLKKIPEIDLISFDEFGEFMVFRLLQILLQKGDVHSLPNIAYLNMDQIVINPNISQENGKFLKRPFDFIPLPNRTLLSGENWDIYLSNFKKIKSKYCSKENATGVTTMNRARGCLNHRHRCAYCGIGDLNIYTSSAKSFWGDILKAKEDINANFFYECFDNFTYSTDYLKELLNNRPNPLDDVNLCVYSSANKISQKTCDILRPLGVYLVNLGLDSGDEWGLKLLKGDNVALEDNYHAVNLLTKNNFEMHISFVLMGVGSNKDTRRSLDKTVEFIEYLANHTSVTIIDCALFYPDKNAPVGGLIWTPSNYRALKNQYHLSYIDTNALEKANKKWKNQVYIDSAEITKDFAHICGTDFDLLLEYQHRIKDICNKCGISFGYSQAGKLE